MSYYDAHYIVLRYKVKAMNPFESAWYKSVGQACDMAQSKTRSPDKLETRDYALLADFRFALRSFLHFSESAAAKCGLTAQHYQAMLALRGCPEGQRVTINDLAQQLLIRHNSAVGLSIACRCRGWSRARPPPRTSARSTCGSRPGAAACWNGWQACIAKS